MGKPTGFLEIAREKPAKRPVAERVRDSLEFEGALGEAKLREQGARCMDCGVPFCHQGCPLGNVIPEWNDHVYRGRMREASVLLHATNNFPEFTGRVCPAPCEEACVLNLRESPVTIRQIEREIADRAFDEGWVVPQPAKARTGRTVAVVGSGPAGLACAQQLARAGHAVTVFERADRVGGLLRYGIPDFKLEKIRVDRRVVQMEAEGVTFRTGVDVGRAVTGEQLRKDFDAVVLAVGATRARELPVPGRELAGVHLAMEYLEQHNRFVAGDSVPGAISAAGKRVVVLGGGDTGADCVGTAHRQGAASVLQLELMPQPPATRAKETPWPNWPLVMRTSSAHEEGGARDWSVLTKGFADDGTGRVRALRAVRVAWEPFDKLTGEGGAKKMVEVPDSEFEIEADLVLLALGFVGADANPLYESLGVSLGARGTVEADATYMTATPGVFSCGDGRRGQSLVVWAIAEGREAARGVEAWLRAKAG